MNKAYSPQLLRELAALREAALGDDYAYQQVAHLTENIGPRPPGSPQAAAAVNYVAEELRHLGLEVRLEEVRVRRWERGLETAELVEYPGQAPGTTQKIVLTALGRNTPTSAEGLTAEVVVVRSFQELKALGREKVAGKIVLFNVPFDKQKASDGFWGEAYGEAVAYRGDGAKAAADLGAIASLVRSVGGADYRIPHTGWNQAAGIPAGAVTSEDAELIAHLATQGRVRMHLVLTSQNGPEVMSYNVVGDVKGSEHPEQVVVVSGHLDSWDLGTGAIDDAAGVAVAMETAQLVQRLHLRPKRTIRVIAWMDEENGGRGHEAYAKAHAAEFGNHVAAIESDLGAGHPLGFWSKVNPDALPLLQPVQDILRPQGANLVKMVDESPGADIAPLSKAGVPAFGVLQDGRTYFNYHHTAADTLDKIVPQELRENAAATAVLGYALANMTDPLPR
ncbi:MAG TPA: M20/M25/M40 family metallo-hydrolase [Terriglobales bacterium]|nr:M20/M25/M40 family metallo-hydrolase [Terriglobales bacterium]